MVKVVPLILEAEVYENPAPTAKAVGGAHRHDGNETAASTAPASVEPSDSGFGGGFGGGFERAAFTLLADLIVAIGYAFMLAGAFALSGRDVDWRRGILWGLAGFAAFSLSPAVGLAPELPGMASGDLVARQTWWFATVGSAAAGLGLIFFAGPLAAKIAGGFLIALPHLIGAPIHLAGPVAAGSLPPALAAEFAVASLAISGLFWMVLGGAAGYVYKRFTPA